MASEELIKSIEEVAKKKRLFVLAKAYLQRGRSAGIPKRHLRIKENVFAELLCDSFHKDTKAFAKSIYKNPKILFQKKYILIDGGDIESRKMAGCAILFRMIACDKQGKVYNCSSLAGEFKVNKKDWKEESRASLVRKVKKTQILLLSEFDKRHFSIYSDSGIYFDQLLEYRSDYEKSTILTFERPLESKVTNTGNAIKDTSCGVYLSMLSHADIKENDNIFRIKLK